MRFLGRSALNGAARRLALPIATAALVVSPLGAVAAAPGTDGAPAPEVSEPADAAVEVLEQLTATLDGERGPAEAADAETDLTTELVTLQQVYDDLPATERREARRLLARPTDPVANPVQDLVNYKGAPVISTCNTRICVHRVASGKHQATAAWATQTLNVVDAVWNAQIGTMGYRAPVSDGNKGNPAGVTGSRLDVYLGELSADGYYGYANWDPSAPHAGYLVLDNNYAGFATSPLDTLKVTAAHEFFHVVQFGYSRKADTWLMETTATWMEEQLYDSINDNRQYLTVSALARPAEPLDSPGFYQYGNWVFFENIAQRHGQQIVRAIWNKVAAGKTSTQAINRAAKARGSDLATEFTRFAADNTVPRKTYSEGGSYPKAKPVSKPKLGKSKRASAWKQLRIDHLSAATTRFAPKGKLGKKWRLQVQLRGASRVRAEVLVHRTDGTVVRHKVLLKKGSAKKRVAFDTKRVAKVSVTLANTSAAYRCHRGKPYTCRGLPKHDREPAQVRGVLSKR
ncbi:MXAN_6640 family putative metalloprotease [Nocardioides daejeonensis]|uniref:MXAN_6640 family putative metalloprotease n=1 Tax=Nocardioides daejeonensis TaxID=1046556 RepID=UPI000D7409CE|nr:MXAN_6640 family putative metalloprotease [Nocardioides daejeonensis]